MLSTDSSVTRTVIRFGNPDFTQAFIAFVASPSKQLVIFFAVSVFGLTETFHGTTLAGLVVPFLIRGPAVVAVTVSVILVATCVGVRVLTMVHEGIHALALNLYGAPFVVVRFGRFVSTAYAPGFALDANRTTVVAGLPFAVVTIIFAILSMVFPSASDVCGMIVFAHALGCVPDLQICVQAARYHKQGFRYVDDAQGRPTMSVDGTPIEAIAADGVP